ncbi:tetratricopeptide repeat protein [Streptacidiphilus sp. PAMC 29251]
MRASRTSGQSGPNRALVVCVAVAGIAVLGTFSQIIAQTLPRGGLAFWLLTAGAAVLTAGAAVMALFPVKTRDTPADEEPRQLPPHNLPPLTTFFTGRNRELAAIEAALRPHHATPRGRRGGPGAQAAPRVCTVHGLGGVGKSQLSLAYAKTHLEQHLITRWLNASRPNTLRGELLELAACVGVPYNVSKTVMLTKLWGWLRDHPGWLLVYDDVQEFPDVSRSRESSGLRGLSRYLPPEGRGEILITTQRRGSWDGLSDAEIALAPLVPVDGLAFLRARTGEDEGEFTELGNRLGWLPLALEQAGAYIDQAGIGIQDYLDHLPELAAIGDADEKTFALAIERVTRTQPAAEDLLRLCAFLASEDVPTSTLYRYRAVLPERLRRAMSDQPSFNRTVALLVNHSLLTRSGEGRAAPLAYGLHPRVQLFIRHRLDQLGRLEWSHAAVRLVEAAFPATLEHQDLREASERLMPHVEASTSEFSWGNDAEREEWEGLDATAGSQGTGDPEAIVRLLRRAGCYQEYRCDWTRALSLFEQEAQLRDLGIGGDLLGRAEARLAVARQYFLLARLDEAEAACREALGHCAGHRAEPDFLRMEAKCLRELGGVLREQVRFAEALEAIRTAIKIYEGHGSGWETLDWAIAEQQAGMVHRNAGRPAEATACYRRAALLVPGSGSQEPAEHLLFRAMLRRDLGIVAQDMGDLDLAERELRAALLAFQEQGASDFDTAQVSKFLADVLRRQGERSLAAVRPLRHPLRGRALRGQAAARLDEAWVLLGPAVALHQRRRDTEEHKYAACLNKRGSLELALGRAADARATLEEAEGIYRLQYGENHHYRAKALSRLGPVLLALGDADRAVAVLREAEAIFLGALGEDHPVMVAVWQSLADCLQGGPEADFLRQRADRLAGTLLSGTTDASPLVTAPEPV